MSTPCTTSVHMVPIPGNSHVGCNNPTANPKRQSWPGCGVFPLNYDPLIVSECDGHSSNPKDRLPDNPMARLWRAFGQAGRRRHLSAEGTAMGVRDERGQTLAETALILPVLLLLLLGMADLGRMASAYLSIQHAAREGVRLGVTGAADADIVARVRSSAAAIDAGSLTVNVQPAESARLPGSDIAVEVRYPFRPVAFGWLFGGEVTLRVRLVSRVE